MKWFIVSLNAAFCIANIAFALYGDVSILTYAAIVASGVAAAFAATSDA